MHPEIASPPRGKLRDRNDASQGADPVQEVNILHYNIHPFVFAQGDNILHNYVDYFIKHHYYFFR